MIDFLVILTALFVNNHHHHHHRHTIQGQKTKEKIKGKLVCRRGQIAHVFAQITLRVTWTLVSVSALWRRLPWSIGDVSGWLMVTNFYVGWVRACTAVTASASLVRVRVTKSRGIR